MLTRARRRASLAVLGLPRRVRPAHALREAFREGYGAAQWRADLGAGAVVGIVALPLSMALAIASGLPPQHGLYTAVVAGFVTALLGGSRTQVSGPTAAFVVLLAPVCARHGPGGLFTATVLAGAMLVLLGLLRFGRLLQFIPHPVTTGFTAGIAVVIASLQVKDLLGLAPAGDAEHFAGRLAGLAAALPGLRPWEAATGAFTLALLVGLPRITRRVPAPLVALAAAGLAAAAAERWGTGIDIATLGERFSYPGPDGSPLPGIPRTPPHPVLPWNAPGPGGAPFVLDLATLRALLPSAFAIALLGAIESLLSAVVSDGMAGTRHDPDAELVAQGAGNLVAPFFGGFAATGALARTATNVRAGGRSPVAAMAHAAFVLVAVLVLAPVLGALPMASLAALLLLVAWNMSEVRHFARLLRIAPRSDVAVLLATFSLTVVFDMVVSVTVGVVLAALLFMKRMAEVSGARVVGDGAPGLRGPLPPGVVVYGMGGPLFFGAAGRAFRTLERVAGAAKVVVLDLGEVPDIDATGLVALEDMLERLHREGTFVVLAGVRSGPARTLRRAGIVADPGRLAFASTAEQAVALAAERAR